MRSNDLRTKLQDGFEPGPLQIGPDGGLHVSPEALVPPPPPRLCEAGPCRNYHRFTTELDAERPIGASVEQGEEHGRITGDAGPAPFHVSVHHYCYPTVGVETDLGDMAVLECNRWDPHDDLPIRLRRDTWMRTEAGQAYQDELAQWRAARAAEAAALDSALPVVKVVIVAFTYDGGGEQVIDLDTNGETTLRNVRELALRREFQMMDGRRDFTELQDEWLFYDSDGNEITNLDATLHMLGIGDGERLTLRKGT